MSGIINEYMQVQARIKRMSPRYATLTQPPILTLKEIQAEALDPDTMLLEYKLGEQRSYLWAVTRTSFRSFALPKRAEIEAAARQAYELFTARNRHPAGETPLQRQERLRQADEAYPAAAANLSRMLLSPLASLRGVKRLLIVGDGAVQYIPFAALPDLAAHTGATESLPAQPLIVNYEIVNLPSISVIYEIRRERRRLHAAPPLTIAVLADPVFDKNDMRVRRTKSETGRKNLEARRAAELQQPLKPESSLSGVTEIERALAEAGVMEDNIITPRLLLSRREAQAILAYAPPGKSMAALNFDASRATATSGKLARYRFVHFATHGLLNSQHPELSGIVLSLVDERGQTQDGFLRLNEIYNLKLSAELVVLSACQTGLGKEIRGEGLIGLTRGFMYAGAERVAASLWKVDDAATAELMTRFYRGILRESKTPAAALRAAQVEVWQQQSWRAPYYWAAFILQGEWK